MTCQPDATVARACYSELPKGTQWELSSAFEASIESFFPESIKVLRPLKILVRSEGDDFLASFFDANINASGDTAAEAILNLKDMIVATMDLLDGLPKEKLGPGPKRQIDVLRHFLERSN